MPPLPWPALATLILTVAFAASPLVTPPFTGFEDGQLLVPQPDPLIQPAGWAFSIWGVIYLWLIVSAVVGLWRRAADPGWDRARAPLMVSLAIGAPWLWVATVSPIAASVMIFGMLVFAVIALLRAPRADWALLAAPVGLYAGWLTAASAVSLGVTMAGYGVLDGTAWAYIGVPLAAAVALAVLLARRDGYTYGVAVLWALTGILAKSGLEPLSFAGLVGAVMVLLIAVLVIRGRPPVLGATP